MGRVPFDHNTDSIQIDSITKYYMDLLDTKLFDMKLFNSNSIDNRLIIIIRELNFTLETWG